jgi:hypothetical protein
MEQDGVSTKTGMQRLHPLQRTTWTRLRDGTGIAQASPFQILGKQPMKTSDAGDKPFRTPQTLQRAVTGSTGIPRVRLGVEAPHPLHFTRAW